MKSVTARVRELVSRIFVYVERPDPEHVEQAARFLVQKIARENAAEQALMVARLSNATARECVQLNKKRIDALRLRNFATGELRLALGLPEHPTQAECSDWGEAP